MRRQINFFLLVFISIFFSACSKKEKDETTVSPAGSTEKTTSSSEKTEITFTTYVQEDGWGYDIFVNGKMYIHQPNIPAVSGLHTFQSEADAQKAAAFVKMKIEKNILPPSVSPEELDSLGLLHF